MNHRTRINRLLKLADHLEQKVAVADFNMQVWFFENECGTAACALGHACSIPSFRRAGLKLGPISPTSSSMTPSYLASTEFEAGAYFFGIDLFDAKQLFAASSYNMSTREIQPKHVATRIRRLVKRLEREYRREVNPKRPLAIAA